MKKANGYLLLTAENLETNLIPENERDKAVFDFYVMKSEAEQSNDKFYVLQSLYSHRFSYGVFYPDFMNMSWQDFRDCKSLKGVSQSTFELMQSFCKCPVVQCLSEETDFCLLDEPRTFSGYHNAQQRTDFVCDICSWEDWHRKWYVIHPEQIDWTMAVYDWFPRPDLIVGILRRELTINLGEQETDIIPLNRVVTEFHDKIMRHKGSEIEAYAGRIGEEICLCNYYVFESELSALEQQVADGSFRKVFSIINRYGKRQFISIDFRHGMFEFHDEHGTHLGEFRFDGSPNTDADESHSLRCVQQWLRQIRHSH